MLTGGCSVNIVLKRSPKVLSANGGQTLKGLKLKGLSANGIL